DREHARESVVDYHDEHHERDGDRTGTEPLVDRVLSKARIDDASLGDAEWHRQRTRTQNDGEVLRITHVTTLPHRDLPVRSDRALHDWRPAHDATVEHDGHVILNVATGLLLEPAATLVAQRELNDGTL